MQCRESQSIGGDIVNAETSAQSQDKITSCKSFIFLKDKKKAKKGHQKLSFEKIINSNLNIWVSAQMKLQISDKKRLLFSVCIGGGGMYSHVCVGICVYECRCTCKYACGSQRLISGWFYNLSLSYTEPGAQAFR